MKSTEPMWWALFSAGGMLAAMFLPVLIVVTGVLVPLGVAPDGALAYERVYPVLAHPLARLVLLALLALPLFHAAHRIVHTLIELGLRDARRVLGVLGYGAAIAGTVVAAWLVWRI